MHRFIKKNVSKYVLDFETPPGSNQRRLKIIPHNYDLGLQLRQSSKYVPVQCQQ